MMKHSVLLLFTQLSLKSTCAILLIYHGINTFSLSFHIPKAHSIKMQKKSKIVLYRVCFGTRYCYRITQMRNQNPVNWYLHTTLHIEPTSLLTCSCCNCMFLTLAYQFLFTVSRLLLSLTL